MGSVFGAYDIRGLYPEEINEAFAESLGKAIAAYISPNSSDSYLVGHDSRVTSPLLARVLCTQLVRYGQQVTSMGLSSTPRVYWEGAENKYDCSIAVTASHLSSKHNGFKICRRDAQPVSSENGLSEIHKLMDKSFQDRAGGKLIPYSSRSLDRYVEHVHSFFALKRPISVVVDTGGSPVGPEVEALLDSTPLVRMHALDLEPTGTFLRRSPNPLDEGALVDLSNAVVETKSDFGVAFDGDGDRIVVVDERGIFTPTDFITALLAERLFKSKPGAKILYDLRSSRAVPEHIKKLGGEAFKSRIGHSSIKRDMQNLNASLAGELSAHYYWSDMYCTDNALRVLVELLNILSNTRQRLSELTAPLQTYANSGEINFKVPDVSGTMQLLATRFSDGQQSWIDGLSVDYESWWFNARASQTEPVLRLCVGSATKSELEAYVKSLTDFIKGTTNGCA